MQKTTAYRKQMIKRRRREARRRVALLSVICVCLTGLAVAVIFLGEPENSSRALEPGTFGTIMAEDRAAEKIPEPEEKQEEVPEEKQEEVPEEKREKVPEEIQEEAPWNLILVNKENPFSEEYQVELIQMEGGEAVDERIYDELCRMLKAAEAESVYPVVVSGYRTQTQQQNLLDEKIEEYRKEGYTIPLAKEKARQWVALPGTSEHQIGLAVDINADGINSRGEEVYQWLEKNAAGFGFIKRYPADKTKITGVINEPWHYRYVGVEAAMKIQEQGICLEEYLLN